MYISAKPWKKNKMPERVLAIRLQAMGDVVITLPYLQALRNVLPPSTAIDLLTRKEVDSIPRNLNLFNKVYSIGGKRNFRKQFIYACFLLPSLLLKRYDVVIDLQNNQISRLVRRSVMSSAWSEFDTSSPIAAGERTRAAIESLGLGNIHASSGFSFKHDLHITDLLKQNGWNGTDNLVIINPAGAFETRNWPIENYAALMRLWLQQVPQTQFLILGIELIKAKGAYLENIFKDKLIDLVDKTNPAEALAIMQKVKFVLSEDSGLIHFAWVSGIPTLALFGSTRSDWSRPLGEQSLLLDSTDLPCGNCLLEFCKYGDVHCLTRYTPEFVFEKALQLMQMRK
jgi:ADP-heptose:LPS heptosyltransferase